MPSTQSSVPEQDWRVQIGEQVICHWNGQMTLREIVSRTRHDLYVEGSSSDWIRGGTHYQTVRIPREIIVDPGVPAFSWAFVKEIWWGFTNSIYYAGQSYKLSILV